MALPASDAVIAELAGTVFAPDRSISLGRHHRTGRSDSSAVPPPLKRISAPLICQARVPRLHAMSAQRICNCRHKASAQGISRCKFEKQLAENTWDLRAYPVAPALYTMAWRLLECGKEFSSPGGVSSC